VLYLPKGDYHLGACSTIPVIVIVATLALISPQFHFDYISTCLSWHHSHTHASLGDVLAFASAACTMASAPKCSSACTSSTHHIPNNTYAPELQWLSNFPQAFAFRALFLCFTLAATPIAIFASSLPHVWHQLFHSNVQFLQRAIEFHFNLQTHKSAHM
jgi:hypothetical protein